MFKIQRGLFVHFLLLFSISCSKQDLKTDNFILYGVPDTSQEHQAVVYISMGAGACSGTLITSDVVLTAAHCADTPENITINFGNDINSIYEQRAVSEVLVHPNWDPDFEHTNNLMNDIALMRLETPAPASITPIPPLPPELAVSDADIGVTELVYVGFGLTETGDFGQKLTMSRLLDYICENDTDQYCTYNLDIGAVQVNPHTISIEMDTNGGICSGDSGGPDLITRNGIEYVAGINSWVLQDGSGNCAYLGTGTKVDHYYDFISSFVNLDYEQCSNGLDDDNDGFTDCEDPDCENRFECLPDICDFPVEITCDTTIEDTTEDGISKYTSYGTCLNSQFSEDGPEKVYVLTAPDETSVTVKLDLISAGDLDVFLLKGGCDSELCINASTNSPGESEELSIISDGQPVYFMVDTFQDAGSFKLSVECVSPEICDNVKDDDKDGLTDCEDPDCEDSDLCIEVCNDGIDNNGNGLTDCEDPDCENAEHCAGCDDGIDNDGNGFTDCEDPDCTNIPVCSEPEIVDDRNPADGCSCGTVSGSRNDKTPITFVLFAFILAVVARRNV